MKMFGRRLIGVTLAMTILFSSVVYADVEDETGNFEEIVEQNTDTTDEPGESDEVTDELTEDDTTEENNPEEPEEAPAYDGDGEEKIYADGDPDKTYQLKYQTIATNSVEITGYTGTASGDLVIPSTINGKSVTSIGAYAFNECSGFTGSLTIPNSVTEIGHWAFYDCTGFTGSLTIPNSVTSIDGYAFFNCSGFTGNLTIPDSVTKIGNYAFSGCRGFTGGLTIPNSVTSIWDYTFSGCSGFTGSLTIPNSVTEIKRYAFYGCGGFTGSLTIPNSVTSIGAYAFSGCSGFTGSLTIPNSVTEIGSGTFNGCSGFAGSLTIPNSVTEIGSGTFNGCSGFAGSLTIPSSVKTIGNSAFRYCGFTGNLTIPDSVTEIGSYAFESCEFTGSLIIPNSVTKIGHDAFYGCGGFTGSLTIPNSVTSIGAYAFFECGGLTSVINYSDFSVELPIVMLKTWKNITTGEDNITTLPGKQTAVRSDYEGDKFHFYSSWDDNEECEFNFDESWFFQPSSTYNHALARMSIRAAMAAFTSPTNGTDARNIEELMNRLEMKYTADSIVYNKPSDKDGDGSYNTIGYAIASRKIENKNEDATLVLVTVRGANYKTEWGSNFYVKNKKSPDEVNAYDHAGFSLAAKQVKDGLDKYVLNLKPEEKKNVKIWICGYSRAAATSNLVAQRVIDYGTGGLTVKPNNVFAFCFECPQNTATIAGGVINPQYPTVARYNGIYNVVNPVDFVPQVAMNNGDGWKYTRYGRTLTIPSVLTDEEYDDNQDGYADRVKKKYKYLSEELEKWNTSKKDDTISLIKTNDEKVVGKAYQRLVEMLAGATESPTNYKEKCQDDFVELAAILIGEKGETFFGFLKECNDYLENKVDNWILQVMSGNSKANFADPDDLNKIIYSKNPKSVHYPELCLTWMDTLERAELVDSSGNPIKRKYRDIEITVLNVLEFLLMSNNSNATLEADSPSNRILIYDSKNNLVGKVVNGVCEDIDSGIFVAVNDNGQILITAPGDEQYTIKIESDKDTKAFCTIREVDAGNNELERAVVYSDINIKKSETADINIGKSTETQTTSYSITDGNKKPVAPATDIKGDSIKYFNVEIKKAPNGTTYGAGSYIKNQQATVVATPNAGYRFKCWKSGVKKVSDNAYYSFKVTANVTLTPVFEKGEAKVLVKSIKISPSSKTLKKGKTVTLKAKIAPSNASNKKVAWKSSNKKVAKVNSKGKVTAVAPGTAKITATAKDGSKKKATATIKVKGVALNGKKLTVQKGKTSKTIKATVISDSIKSVKSSNKKVATVKLKGKKLNIKGVSTGKANITVKGKSGMKATLKVTVQKDKVTTKTLKLSKSTVNLAGKGKTATVNVTATPDRLSTNEKITVTNSKKSIASFKINQNTGEITVTAKKKGTCKLTVKVGKKTKKITVKVTK